MRSWMAGLLLVLPLGVMGCGSRENARVQPVPASRQIERPASAPVPKPVLVPPAPREPQKEIVIAWQLSLLYLLVDGEPIGKPLVLNSSKPEYLRDRHLGEFTISEKIREWRSNLYDNYGDPLPDRSMAQTHGAIMRNWMRVGDLGVGLHHSPAYRYYRKPSQRHRSHGCYRMSRKDSRYVFAWAPKGTPVHVVRSLAGTRWAFLRLHTPPELMPGYKPRKRSAAKKSTPAGTAKKARHAQQ